MFFLLHIKRSLVKKIEKTIQDSIVLGDFNLCSSLLDIYAEDAKWDDEPKALMIHAIQHGQYRCIEKMYQLGICDMERAIIYAIRTCRNEALQKLIEMVPSDDQVGIGAEHLNIPIKRMRVDIVKIILDAPSKNHAFYIYTDNVDSNDEPSYNAGYFGQISILKLISNCGEFNNGVCWADADIAIQGAYDGKQWLTLSWLLQHHLTKKSCSHNNAYKEITLSILQSEDMIIDKKYELLKIMTQHKTRIDEEILQIAKDINFPWISMLEDAFVKQNK